jgi:hypothetical protein
VPVSSLLLEGGYTALLPVDEALELGMDADEPVDACVTGWAVLATSPVSAAHAKKMAAGKKNAACLA